MSSVASNSSTPTTTLETTKKPLSNGQLLNGAPTKTASRASTAVASWQRQTKLTREQLAAVDAVDKMVTKREEIDSADTSTSASTRTADVASGSGGATSASSLPRAEDIENMQEFYAWFAALQSSESADEQQYSNYLDRLRAYQLCTDNVCANVANALQDLVNMEEQYKLVAVKTGELHRECESLLEDQQRLACFADGLAEKLEYFNELERLSRTLAQPGLSAADEPYRKVLQRVDDCVAFVQQHIHYQDAPTYLVKFRMQQVRALTSIKQLVVTALHGAGRSIREKQLSKARGARPLLENNASIDDSEASVSEAPPIDDATASEMAAVEAVSKNDHSSAAAGDASLYYAKFRALAPRVRPLTSEIERRAARRECLALLTDCHAAYFDERALLLGDVVARQLDELLAHADAKTVARSCCAYLLRVAELEWRLYRHFFARASPALARLLTDLSAPFCDALRQRVIATSDLDQLCAVAHILSKEVIEEQIEPRGAAAEAFRPVVDQVLQDVQERLAFLAQRHVHSDIDMFVPSDADLDYPTRLHAAQRALEAPPPADDVAATHAAGAATFSTWYTPLHSTLMLLSKVYLAVDLRVFEGVAHEAVSACTGALVAGSKAVSAKHGGIDGLLFLVRHLLILREQIQPFDVDFSIRETTLDVGHLLGAVGQLLAGKRSLLSAVPRVLDLRVDSRQDLEKALRHAIEAFIVLVTSTLAQPLLHVETLAAAHVHVHGRSTGSDHGLSLAATAFAAPAQLDQAVQQVLQRLGSALPAIVASTAAYLSNTTTQQILFRPIKANLLQCFDELYSLLDRHYTPAERALVNVIARDELVALLEREFAVRPAADAAPSPRQQQRQQKSVDEPITQPSVEVSADTQPNVDEPITQPNVDEPITQPNVDEPITQPNVDEPITQPNIDEPITQPNVDKAITQPNIDEQ